MKIKEIHDIKQAYLFLQKSFDPSELREYAWMQELYAKKQFQIYAYIENHQLIGVITLWAFDDFNYIEHFAVDENYRGQGIGSMMIRDIQQIRPKPLVLEVEEVVDEMTQKRVDFYEKNGFVLSPCHFIQPPLRDNVKEVALILMSYPQLLEDDMYQKILDELKRKVYAGS